MRRRPQEQHDGQNRRDELRRRIDRRRAGKYGKAPGKPAHDDVPGAAALQPDGIDHAIGKGAQEDIGRRDMQEYRADPTGLVCRSASFRTFPW